MKILFLGETYRADAQTWINGLTEFGSNQVFTWELKTSGTGIKKILRGIETLFRLNDLKTLVNKIEPELIIAERITSYGFIAALFHKRAQIAIAQQGITDIFPVRGIFIPLKVILQRFAFKHATIIHAWGIAMTYSMIKQGVDPLNVLILAKGIDLRKFKFKTSIESEKIRAIVTRSLTKDYRHETILKAFALIKAKGIPFELQIVGDGILMDRLVRKAKLLEIERDVIFCGRITNSELPELLSESDLYISMPCTEGVSSSLFEAFASGCYPIVTDLPGNRAWIKDKINGMLVPLDDYISLASSIEEYYYQRSLITAVLYQNRITVETKASYEKNMKEICCKYSEIINTGK